MNGAPVSFMGPETQKHNTFEHHAKRMYTVDSNTYYDSISITYSGEFLTLK